MVGLGYHVGPYISSTVRYLYDVLEFQYIGIEHHAVLQSN